MSIAAFIPARGGSERIAGKNIRKLGGYPLLAYAIAGARNAGIFDQKIYVSTEDDKIAAVAREYGAEVLKRPARYAQDDSPDIEWIEHALEQLPDIETGMILRPTNPFRTPSDIKAAWKCWLAVRNSVDSLRSIRPVQETPYKMWNLIFADFSRIQPLLHHWGHYYDAPTQEVPPVYIQNGAIQIFTRKCIELYGNQTGSEVVPFLLTGPAALDLNDEWDWMKAEKILETGLAALEEI